MEDEFFPQFEVNNSWICVFTFSGRRHTGGHVNGVAEPTRTRMVSFRLTDAIVSLGNSTVFLFQMGRNHKLAQLTDNI